MKNTITISFFCGLILMMGCATGQDRVAIIEQHVISAENRISEIESRMNADKESGLESEQGLRERFADMRTELDQLQNDIRNFTGRLDQIEFQLGQDTSARDNTRVRMDEDVRVNSERIVRIEEYLNLEPVTPKQGDVVQNPQKAEPVTEMTEEQLYLTAKKAFDQNNLEAAREGFEKLIKRYPKSPNADNAQFWVGEVYYREKWYEKAILEYQKVIENYPKGNKVQSALLKQGLSFLNLGDKANARLILKELANKFPKSSEAEIARTKLKEL